VTRSRHNSESSGSLSRIVVRGTAKHEAQVKGKVMSNMQRVNIAHAKAFPPGLGLSNMHTAIPGMVQNDDLLQQGDLLFERLAGAPQGNRRIASNSLAVSELTGASHIATGDVTVWQALDGKNNPLEMLYLEVGSNGAEVVHTGEGDQHATMPVEPGWHSVSGVREVDPMDAHETVLRAAD